MQKQQGANNNLLYIDGLRAIAAIYVLLHHAVLQYFEVGPEGLHGLQKGVIYALYQGQLFVDLFIVLSGYCLMRPVIKAGYELQGGSLVFFKKRILRILPPYYLAMVMSLILIWLFVGKETGTHWDVSIPVDLWSIVLHLFLVHDVFSAQAFTINHSFWSISVECRIYILFPLMVYLWIKRGPWYTLSLFVVVSILIYQLLYMFQDKTHAVNLYTPGFSPYVILFIMGMLAADFTVPAGKLAVYLNKVNWGLMLIASVIVFMVTRVVINKFHVDAQTFTYQLINIAFGLICFVLLILCANPANNKIHLMIRDALSWKPLAFIGTFAYSTYLVHAPVIQLLTQYLVAPLQLSRFNASMVLLLLCLLVILPVFYLFFVFCERPFMKLGKKYQKPAEVNAVNHVL
jgi:peptidoglycan/LPS O-acetylase OafA/YrhL